MRKIIIADTTLRNGGQGNAEPLYEKMTIARQLQQMKVDIIEVGFPGKSRSEFDVVKKVAAAVQDGPAIMVLTGTMERDIKQAYESIKTASRPMIHVAPGVVTDRAVRRFTLSPEDQVSAAVAAIRYAKMLVADVQYSTTSGIGVPFEAFWQSVAAVVRAGATVINITDADVGTVPEEFGFFIGRIQERLKNLNNMVVLSVRCYNGTGLGTANALSAVKHGADKVECSICGGASEGVVSLAEVVRGLRLRPDYYGAYASVCSKMHPSHRLSAV